MSQTTEATVKNTLSQKIVPLASIGSIDTLRSTVKALHDGGSKIFELTLRDNDVVALVDDYIKFSRKEYPDMAAGFGSVSDIELAKQVLATKPDFLVSPGYSNPIRIACQEAGVLYMPGCQTATELTTIIEHKLPIAKLFPGGTLGIANAKAMLAPFARYRNQTRVMVTGGVSLDKAGSTVGEWLKVVDAVGMGSIIGDLANKGQFDQIATNMQEAIKAGRV